MNIGMALRNPWPFWSSFIWITQLWDRITSAPQRKLLQWRCSICQPGVCFHHDIPWKDCNCPKTPWCPPKRLYLTRWLRAMVQDMVTNKTNSRNNIDSCWYHHKQPRPHPGRSTDPWRNKPSQQTHRQIQKDPIRMLHFVPPSAHDVPSMMLSLRWLCTRLCRFPEHHHLPVVCETFNASDPSRWRQATRSRQLFSSDPPNVSWGQTMKELTSTFPQSPLVKVTSHHYIN